MLMFGHGVLGATPPKINIEPENDGLERWFSFSSAIFSGEPC